MLVVYTMPKYNKKGGYLGSLLQQAIVPFALLGLQNKFNRNKTIRRRPGWKKRTLKRKKRFTRRF